MYICIRNNEILTFKIKNMTQLHTTEDFSHVRFDNEWHELQQESDGKPYFIYYGIISKPNGVKIHFEVHPNYLTK